MIGRAKFVAVALEFQSDSNMHPDSSSSLVATYRLHHHYVFGYCLRGEVRVEAVSRQTNYLDSSKDGRKDR